MPSAAKQRQLLSQKDFSSKISDITKCVNSMAATIEKRTDDKELYPEELRNAVEESVATAKQLAIELKTLKTMAKELYNKKRHVSNSNLGLRAPQYVTAPIVRFINEHGNLPQELHVSINEKGYGPFDRSTMTTFWSYYARENGLKNAGKGGMTSTDINMNRLFGAVIPDKSKYGGKTYYQVMVEEIKELQQSQNYKPHNSNRAQFEPAESDGTSITSFNNAALQILLKPFFQNEYKLPHKESLVPKLFKIKKYFVKKEPEV